MGRGRINPLVDVRLISESPVSASHDTVRVCLVVERELMHGLRRELVRAFQVRRSVRFLSFVTCPALTEFRTFRFDRRRFNIQWPGPITGSCALPW